jgi:hypothetical protein
MNTALIWLLVAGVAVLLWHQFFPSYLQEKGKNLATKEDIAQITKQVEEVKDLYAKLRLAAVDRRLAAHQEAFVLWRRLMSKVHSEEVHKVVLECQAWWEANCLYLNADARDSFNRAYMAASAHRILTQNPTEAKAMRENWAVIQKAAVDILAAVQLPSLGSREASVEEGASAASLKKLLPSS